jgi:heme A synthase
MTIFEIHARLGNTVILFVVILAIWGAWRFLRGQGLISSYWGALVIAEVLILFQGGLGAYMWAIGARPEEGGMHILYGVVSLLPLPLVYVYTKGRDGRPEMLMYTVAFLMLVGLVLRAISTGGV